MRKVVQVIIDRFEGDLAVVELPNRNTIDVSKLLFGDAKPGDVIDIFVNEEETAARGSSVTSRFDRLKRE